MITMEVISALTGKTHRIDTFNSYSFDRTILTPASAFRFTAPGVDKQKRMAIRSGDQVRLSITNHLNHTAIVGVGFIDETDTHITARSVDYVLTGRDTVGQLVDNDTVDSANKIVVFEKLSVTALVNKLLEGTRATQSVNSSLQIDQNRTYAVNTNAGETKINCIQRVLEWCNGLLWADNDGTIIVDKPDFTQKSSGSFKVQIGKSNVLECRVKRNINQAIRQIVTALNTTEFNSATLKAETLQNMDSSLRPYRGTNVGRSISRTFDYSSGTDIINQGQGVGQGSFAPHTLGREYSAREIARENMRILDVEIVVEGHFNATGYLYNVDQIYRVDIDDEDVHEDMYVYHVSYELTMDHGMMTRMRLCRKYTICAYSAELAQKASGT